MLSEQANAEPAPAVTPHRRRRSWWTPWHTVATVATLAAIAAMTAAAIKTSN
jgi:hypothetical protein